MELRDLLNAYITIQTDEQKKLITIAFEEMDSLEYEEAAKHFGQLYENDPSDFMSSFLRAYCKSHLGVRRDCDVDAHKLTIATKNTVEKAIGSENKELYLSLIFSLYNGAMENLYDNAVDGYYKIFKEKIDVMQIFATEYYNLINSLPNVKNVILEILKNDVDRYSGLFYSIAETIVKYDEEFEAVIKERQLKEAKEAKKIKKRKIIIITVICVFFVLCILSGLLL